MTISAESVAIAFWRYWVARFGCPKIIITEQGIQFESFCSRVSQDFLVQNTQELLLISLNRTDHAERWHRTFKVALMCHTDLSWIDVLPTILLGLRTAIEDDIQVSPIDLLYDH